MRISPTTVVSPRKHAYLNSVEHGLSATSSLNPGPPPPLPMPALEPGPQVPRQLARAIHPGGEGEHPPPPPRHPLSTSVTSQPPPHPHPAPSLAHFPPTSRLRLWATLGALGRAGSVPGWSGSLLDPEPAAPSSEVQGTSQRDRGRRQCRSDLWAAREAHPGARGKWLSAASHKADEELAAGRV